MRQTRSVWFRCRYRLKKVQYDPSARMEVVSADAAVSIYEGPDPSAPDKTVVMVEAEIEDQASPEVAGRLASIAAGADPPTAPWLLGDTPHPPDPFFDYCEEMASTLRREARRVFEVARWRTAAYSPESPYQPLGNDFSLDRETWHRLPARVSMEMSTHHGLTTEDWLSGEVQSLLDRGKTEPIAHALLREAADVAVSSPRSGTVIALAAAEAGFKYLASDLVPNAAWFFREAQSPRLPLLLRDFLPQLPIRGRLNGAVVPPPKYLRTLITEGMEERNRIVHQGLGQFTTVRVNELIKGVRDLLYLMDFYAGHLWAIHFVSMPCREAALRETFPELVAAAEAAAEAAADSE
jgi:hypothetical protein